MACALPIGSCIAVRSDLEIRDEIMNEVTQVSQNPLTSAELKELRHAKALLEDQTFTSKLSGALGGPIEKGFKMLPDGWSKILNKAVRKALFRALEVAVATMGPKPPRKSSAFWHKVMVGTSGGIGGVFGLPALLVELPVSTTVMLRSIADIARSEGFDANLIETKLNCLEVFALGGKSPEDGQSGGGYWAVRSALGQAIKEAAAQVGRRGALEKTAPAVVRLISGIASRFGVIVSEEVAAKALPLVGAASGAVINVMFMDHFQDLARGHFIVRRLEAKHGADAVRSAYEAIR